MSASEYEQVVEFLGRQFTEIDRRFDQVDGQIAELRREMLGHVNTVNRRSATTALEKRTAASYGTVYIPGERYPDTWHRLLAQRKKNL